MIDWGDVDRTAHQLALDHGLNAHLYAARLAAEAAEEHRDDEAEFWGAVAATLRPRQSERNGIPLLNDGTVPVTLDLVNQLRDGSA